MTKKTFKVGLPGDLYQKNNRWWWKVKLPGKRRLKERGLKPKGARFATTDRAEGEAIAVAMWESAIRKEVQAEARAKARAKADAAAKELARLESEAAETVARMKSKVVEMIGNAKAECERKVQLSDEAVAQAREALKAESERRAQAEELAKAEAERRVRAEELAQAESERRAQAEELASMEADRRIQAEERATVEMEPTGPDEPGQAAEAEAKLEEVLGGAGGTGTCDCCGKADVPADELSVIDSGQFLCAECLAALRG